METAVFELWRGRGYTRDAIDRDLLSKADCECTRAFALAIARRRYDDEWEKAGKTRDSCVDAQINLC